MCYSFLLHAACKLVSHCLLCFLWWWQSQARDAFHDGEAGFYVGCNWILQVFNQTVFGTVQLTGSFDWVCRLCSSLEIWKATCLESALKLRTEAELAPLKFLRCTMPGERIFPMPKGRLDIMPILDKMTRSDSLVLCYTQLVKLNLPDLGDVVFMAAGGSLDDRLYGKLGCVRLKQNIMMVRCFETCCPSSKKVAAISEDHFREYVGVCHSGFCHHGFHAKKNRRFARALWSWYGIRYGEWISFAGKFYHICIGS